MAPESTFGVKLAAEGLGTYALVFTIGCNVVTGSPVWAGVSIACVLMVMIYALGGISGANFNPAVTLALTVSKLLGGPGLDAAAAGPYMAAQVVGGLAAALLSGQVFHKSVHVGPQEHFSVSSALMCEILYTFMLCFVVLNVAVAKKNSGNQFYGLAIGFVIVAGAYGAGAVSGGSFNPAVSIGLNMTGGKQDLMSMLGYVMAEFVGALFAAFYFRLVRPEDFGQQPNIAAELASEFVGTFMLVLTVGLNVLGHSAAGAFSIAASLMCMIYALGNVSGAHFNPAVTVAILLSGRCPELGAGKAAGYMVTQLLGGAGAAYTYHQVYAGGLFDVKAGAYTALKGDLTSSLSLGPGDGYTIWQAIHAECFFTFVLCYVVLTVAVAKVTNNSTMFGLAIGSCVTVGGNAIGAVSGGSLNPAVSVGIFAGAQAAGGSSTSESGSRVAYYIAGELLGALVAAALFKATHAVDLEDGTADEQRALAEKRAGAEGATEADHPNYSAVDDRA